MLSDEAVNILPIGARFAPKTRGVGDVSNRELLAFEHLFSMDIRNRHFGGRNEKEIWLRDTKQVFFELRELAGSRHGVTIHQEGRQNLAIAMLLGVQIEHEIDQGPFKPRPGILVESEARTGNFGGAGEIKNPKLFTDVPVILCWEVELRWIPPAANLSIFRRAPARGHARFRQIRHG